MLVWDTLVMVWPCRERIQRDVYTKQEQPSELNVETAQRLRGTSTAFGRLLFSMLFSWFAATTVHSRLLNIYVVSALSETM